jgi:hypothetical protein
MQKIICRHRESEVRNLPRVTTVKHCNSLTVIRNYIMLFSPNTTPVFQYMDQGDIKKCKSYDTRNDFTRAIQDMDSRTFDNLK